MLRSKGPEGFLGALAVCVLCLRDALRWIDAEP